MKVLALVPCYNEDRVIESVLIDFPKKVVDEIIVIDDGSTDKSLATIKSAKKKRKDLKFTIISHKNNEGAGSVVRDAINYGKMHGFDVFTLLAGNGKDNPNEIPNLLKPILTDNVDYVQGSRFLVGGSYKDLPKSRKIMIKIFTWIFYAIATNGRYFGTDATNGFRAYKLSIFNDPSIDINQAWLDRYELETYLHYKVVSKNYDFKEVAVTKDYPFKTNYSKIRPFIDWFSILKPIIFLKLGIKS